MAYSRHPQSGLYVPEAALRHPEAPLVHPEAPLAYPEASSNITFSQELPVSIVTASRVAFDPLDWLNILTGAGLTPSLYVQADVGISETGGAVTAWADQSGNARNGTAVGAPAYEATGLNGRAIVTFDGTDDAININWNPQPPATENFSFYCIARMNAGNAAGDRLFSGNSNSVRLGRGASDGTIVANNGTSGAAQTMTVGQWYRIWGLFTGATSGTADELQVGAAAVLPSFFGNTNPTGLAIGATSDGASFGDFSTCLLAVTTTTLAGSVDDLDALTTAVYGVSVEV